MTLCFLQLVHTHVGRLRQPISEAVRNSETAGLSRSSGHQLRCTPWHHHRGRPSYAEPVVGCHFPLDFNPRGRGAPRGNRSSSRRDSVLVPGSGGLGFADRSSSKRDCVLVLAAEVGQGRTLIARSLTDHAPFNLSHIFPLQQHQSTCTIYTCTTKTAPRCSSHTVTLRVRVRRHRKKRCLPGSHTASDRYR